MVLGDEYILAYLGGGCWAFYSSEVYYMGSAPWLLIGGAGGNCTFLL